MLGCELMAGFKYRIHNSGVFRSGNDFEDIASSVVDEDNPIISGQIIIPKSVAVIEKTDVPRYQNGLFSINEGGSGSGRSTSVYTTGTTIAENFIGRFMVK